MAGDNKSLGRFILDGIPPAPRGIPQIEVSFDIDANGILNVKATDKASGKAQHITITASSGLSKEEIEKMKKEAELHADEDNKKKEQAEMKNQVDAVVFQTDKLLKESGDKMKAEDKTELETKLKALTDIKDSDRYDDMKKAMEELNTVAQRIGAAMYQAAQTPPPGSEQAQGATSEQPQAEAATEENKEAPVEGEFEEKK